MIEQPRPVPEAEEQSVFEADFDHTVANWKEEAQGHPYEVDLTSCFVGYGFQLVDGEPCTTDQIVECLQNRPLNTPGHTFFSSGGSPPYRPFVIEVAGHDGLEVHANTSECDHRSVWGLSESLCGTEVMSYWEDTEWIKGAVDSRSSHTWERG